METNATTHPPGEDPAALPALPAEREWNYTWQQPFLRALSVLPDVSSACRLARIGRPRAYQVRREDPEFAGAWDEALEMAHDFVHRQLHTWVTTGVPVRSVRTVTKRKTDRDGNVIDTTTETVETVGAERSAQLMQFWMKAWKPERYRDRVELTGAEGGPIRIETVDELDAKIAALAAEIEAGADTPVPVE